MQKKTMYRYERAGGGVSVSPVLPDGVTEYEVRYRLVADDNRALTDGTSVVACVDTENPEAWTEIEVTAEKAEANMSEDEQYIEAAKILLGVEA